MLCLGMVPQEPQATSHKQVPSDEPSPAERAAATDAHYLNIPVSRLSELLDDPKHRVSPAFHVPEELKPVVGFWLKVYAKYSLYQTLVYDRNHQEIVYEVIDSRELFQKGLSPVALEVTSKNRIKRVLASYKAAMHTLARNPKARFPTGTAGANLIRLWGRRNSREWKQIEAGIRTQPGQRDRIMQGLAAADPFIPAMEAIFRKFAIPIEITRLPLVESSFVLEAKSKAAAVGVWQFLERSATGDDLVVDSDNEIDERLSPIKSTAAAAKMFRRNYRLLHDWGLAIIAYNHGPKNLVPIRDRYGGKNIVKLLQKTSNTPLGYASRNYYAEFLALLHAERYRDEIYGFIPQHHPDAISIVKLKAPASVFQIAAMYNISIHELRTFNPDIFNPRRKLPAGTRVVLPRKHGESIVLAPSLRPNELPAPTRGDGGEAERGIASEEEFIEYVK
ncbi:MAG: transglycosylase SLT domain-containing protein [Deltaproteobacteria bacterium]|nr:transglycosylase SLT domain-containing protein [Deltaproteobacteria bacterium]